MALVGSLEATGDLLRWLRFLSALGVNWEQATRAEGRDFFRLLAQAGKPSRPHWRRPEDGPVGAGRDAPNALTGKGRPGRATPAPPTRKERGYLSIPEIPFVVPSDEPKGGPPSERGEDEMNQYHFYRMYQLEHALSAAEQRAVDQRMGELAAAVADARSAVAHSLCHGLGALKALGRANRTRKNAGVAATVPAGH
ncbi:MAG: hypothetical protein ACRDZX_06910 [Acidimicrobiales bacterium]